MPSIGATPLSRRALLALAVGVPAALIGGGVAAVDLLRHQRAGDVLSGPPLADLTGICDEAYRNSVARGPIYAGAFYSAARRRTVHYTLAYPPGFRSGNVLPLCVYLHPLGGDYESAYGAYPLEVALALGQSGRSLTPMAMVCADGGNGFWHPRPGDDPMAMAVDELIPMCRRIGLGRRPGTVVVAGISMGGYGALLFAERYPHLFAAATAISPSIWPTYAAASAASPSAFASAAEFAAFDVVSHAPALARVPVRVVSGLADPYHPGVVAFAKVAPAGVVVEFRPGGQGGALAHAEAFPSLEFLSNHLPRPEIASELGPVCTAKIIAESSSPSAS